MAATPFVTKASGFLGSFTKWWLAVMMFALHFFSCRNMWYLFPSTSEYFNFHQPLCQPGPHRRVLPQRVWTVGYSKVQGFTFQYVFKLWLTSKCVSLHGFVFVRGSRQHLLLPSFLCSSVRIYKLLWHPAKMILAGNHVVKVFSLCFLAFAPTHS